MTVDRDAESTVMVCSHVVVNGVPCGATRNAAAPDDVEAVTRTSAVSTTRPSGDRCGSVAEVRAPGARVTPLVGVAAG